LKFKSLNNQIMKKLNHIVLLLSLTILAAACNQKEKQAESDEQHTHTNYAPAGTAANISQVNPQAGAAASVVLKDPDLDAVYQQYQKLTLALVDGDFNTAKLSALAIETGARQIKGAGNIATAAATISNTSDLKAQRLAFARLNEAFIALLKNTSLDSGNLYVAHCPMALDDEGASWVSHTKEIRNPYFGDSMLTCGSVTEQL
jgi:hypothetical protein